MKPKVRYQQRPKHNSPRIRAKTEIRKATGMKKPFKASAETKKRLRR